MKGKNIEEKESGTEKTMKQLVVPDDYNYIGVFLTFSCPRGCSYCLNEKTGELVQRKTRTGDEWIASLDRLDTGLVLTFNGGEPLTHPDFYDIMDGLRDSTKVDILTTLPYDAQNFIDNLDPGRFERDLPYPAIRVTYHPENMALDETIRKVLMIKEAGFDIGLYLVDNPDDRKNTAAIMDEIQKSEISCVIKPYLGYLDGKLYGQYSYAGACANDAAMPVSCRTTNLLIDPQGDIYRCHGLMFSQDKSGKIGNIDYDIDLQAKHVDCGRFGFCHPCDVQVKFDKEGRWGYSVADIVGKDVVKVDRSEIDWGF